MASNLDIVRELYAAFGRGDIPALLDQLTDDVEWNDPGAPDIPYAGHYRGRQEVARFFQKIAESTTVIRFEPREYVAAGDHVAAFGDWEARSQATGRELRAEWAMLWEFRDGKVSRFQAYTDTLATAAAHRQSAARGSGA